MPRFSRVREAKPRYAVLQPSVRQVVSGLLWLILGLSCSPLGAVNSGRGHAPEPPEPVGIAAAEGKQAMPATWHLLPERLSVASFEQQRDGRRLFMIRGMRLVERPDGSLSRADEVFERAQVRFVEVPARLGGGYWFYSSSGSQTEIWHAADWTEPLQAVALLNFSVDQLLPGFGGMIAQSGISTRLQWIPWGRAGGGATGTDDSRSALPTAAAFSGLAFSDNGRAVVLASLRGPLATTNFGASWQPLALPGERVEVQLSATGQPQVRTAQGLWEMNAQGRMLRTLASGQDGLFRSLAAAHSRRAVGAEPSTAESTGKNASTGVSPLGPRPLRAALLAGIADSRSTAVVVVGRRVGRVSLVDGRLISSEPFEGVGPCRGVAWGEGVGFVCGGNRTATEIYRYEQQNMTLEARWAGPQRVRSSGNGALIVDAACPSSFDTRQLADEASNGPRAARAELSNWCVLRPEQKPLNLSRRGRREQLRIVALEDGRVVVVEAPSNGSGPNGPERSSASISIVTDNGVVTNAITPVGSVEALHLAKTGLWSPEAYEIRPGELGLWVFAGESFVGMTLSLAGDAIVHSVQQSLRESMFYRNKVLQIVSSVTIRETSDYGETWLSTQLPPAILTRVSPASTSSVRGCSSLGCVYDDWGRIGWGQPLTTPRPPPVTMLPVPVAYSFWSLRCHPAPGEVHSVAAGVGRAALPVSSSRRAQPLTAERLSEAPASSSWLSLMGRRGPQGAGAGRAYDFGQVNRFGGYRAYTWGPAEGPWKRSGRWAVSVQDRFSRVAPWSTAISRSPWSDADQAAAPFGLNFGVTANWRFDLSASGEGALLQVKERNRTLQYFLEPGRAPRGFSPLRGTVGAPKWASVRGAVKLGEEWFVASADADAVRVFRLQDSSLQLLGRYPRVGRFVVRLVGNTEGGKLALWQKTSRTGWYIYPLNPQSGQVGKPLHIARSRLGRTPGLCATQQTGWRVVASVPLTEPDRSESNTHLEFTGGAGPLKTSALAAKLIVNTAGVCVESLAALGQNTLNVSQDLQPGNLVENALPLTVTEPLSERRWAFRCVP